MRVLRATRKKTSESLAAPSLTPAQRTEFVRNLRRWYQQNARVLPWRGIRNPYLTWLSEIMLQQTRVNAVLEHYDRFLRRFPTIISLALAPEEEVLAHWSGLGYYRRARMLHRTAQLVVEEYGGEFPSTAVDLRRLPGIGNYTSAAIASIAFDEPVAVVDGNVERVLLRILGLPETPGAQMMEFLSTVANSLVPRQNPGDHNQAMMELGAVICLPRSPRCSECPVFSVCRTRGEHPTLKRAAMQSQQVRYALTTRRRTTGLEVLLQRRPKEASLMANMLELPQLTQQEAPSDLMLLEEPLLRVRHAITGTNYYVEVQGFPTRRETLKHTLRGDSFEWVPTARLLEMPLTGLARKVLQRMKLMKLPGGQQQEVPLLIGRKGRPPPATTHDTIYRLPLDAPALFRVHPIREHIFSGATRAHNGTTNRQQEGNLAMATERSANAVWQGGLKDGKGAVSTQSGVLKDQSYTFVSRFETGAGTNPEELIAAAHAACFSMALSAELEKAGHKGDSVATTATAVLEFVNGAPTVTTIHLKNESKVPGLDDAKFQEIAAGAKANCPISRLLAAAKIDLDAKLLS